MITISEVIEEVAREIEGLYDPLDSETARCAAAIRALAAQYDGCIVAEGEAVGVYTGKDHEYGYNIINMHDEVPTKTPLYRAKEPTK
jgi:magnesium-transporting ATPase (P-type)